MGLTVHIDARADASLSPKEIAAIVKRWHAAAQLLAAERRLARVLNPTNDPADLNQFATSWRSVPCLHDPNSFTATEVRPSAGWIFLAHPGAGCEPLVLGLCRYPVESAQPGGSDSASEEWKLTTSCKTQYASLNGWEHFLRCHTAVIDLAARGSSLGVAVRIEDEGGYWPQRDEITLRAMLERPARGAPAPPVAPARAAGRFHSETG
jgi:hypothetical protein